MTQPLGRPDGPFPGGPPPGGPRPGPPGGGPPPGGPRPGPPPGPVPGPSYGPGPMPPPGYGPGPAPAPGAGGPPRPAVPVAVVVLGVVAVLAAVVGLSVPEAGHTAWHVEKAWGAVAIAGALLTLAPALAPMFSQPAARGVQLAGIGAGVLAVHWILFVLPDIARNTSLVLTVGALAGGLAAWWTPRSPAAPGGAPGPFPPR